MRSGISQIDYWRAEKAEPNIKNKTEEGGPGATYLSYDVFLGLSVIGGLFALDHLYLRSPLTFLAKLVVNILTLGTWWLYDASQAIFNRDIVKVFGLGVPGLGPKGIGAGVLASEVPDKKHMSFFIYSLALLFGGLFGLDSFILGDKKSGFIRIVCLITGILAPIAILWWLFNIGKFFLKTKDVVNTNWEYFGAPEPAEYKMSWFEKLAEKIPFLQTLFGPINTIKKLVVNTTENVIESTEQLAEGLIENPVKAVETAISKPLIYAEEILTGPVKNVAETVVEPVIAPFKETIDSSLNVAKEGISTIKDGILLGKNVVNKGSNIASKTLNVVGETANSATKALSLVPAAAALSSGFTPAAAATAATELGLSKLKQDGGAIDSSILSYVLVGTLSMIIVSGLFLSYRRFRKNGQPEKNDSPPEPGVLRESYKEKSS